MRKELTNSVFGGVEYKKVRMEEGRRLSSLGKAPTLLGRAEQVIAEASGPHCEAGPCLSSSKMSLGATLSTERPPKTRAWERRRFLTPPPPCAHYTPQD